MKLEDMEEIASLATMLRKLNSNIEWLEEQDQKASCRVSGYDLEGLTPMPSMAAAKNIRAILRADFIEQRDGVRKRLTALGVEFDGPGAA